MSAKSQITVNLAKVQWCSFFYVNQFTETKRTKPKQPTVYGVEIADEPAAYHPDYPHETLIERAKRLDIIDVWTPRCVLHISANRCLTYTGQKAINIHKTYREYIYGKSRS